MKNKYLQFAKGLILLVGVSVAMIFLHRILPEQKHFVHQVNQREVNVTALFYSEEKHALEMVTTISKNEMDHQCPPQD